MTLALFSRSLYDLDCQNEPEVLLPLHVVGQGSAVLAAGVGRVGYFLLLLFSICLLFLMFCLLGDG